MANEQSGRLVRLLNLLPYVSRHQDKTLMEIARDLNMDVAEVRDDLDRLHPVSYTHLTLPTTLSTCRSRWSPYH